MKNFLNYLEEELTPEQKLKVQKWIPKKGKPTAFSDHVFGDSQRLIIPLSAAKSDPHPEVASHLESHGIKITDYQKGSAVDKYGREVKIGKALTKTKAPENIINTFANDSARQAKNHGDLSVVISRHPEDVAAMSTGRNWESCMEMDTGSNKDFLKHDIQHGTHVAYLVKKGDNEAQNPLARISLKPYVENKSVSKHTVLRPETRTYGTGNDAFHNTVREWAETHFPLKEFTTYKPHPKLYDDTAAAASVENPRKNYTHSPLIFKNSKLTKDHLMQFGDWQDHHALAAHGDKEHLDQLAKHDMYHIRATVVEHGHPDHLEDLMKDKHPFVRAGVARHGTDRHRDYLASDKDWSVRREVASLSERQHGLLALDKNADVRAAVAGKSTDRERLGKLAQDTSPYVQGRAKAGLLYLKHLDESKTLNKPTPDRAAY